MDNRENLEEILKEYSEPVRNVYREVIKIESTFTISQNKKREQIKSHILNEVTKDAN